MRRLLVGFCAIVMVWILVAAAQAGVPRAKIIEPHASLKDVMEGDTLTHEFEVLNEGDENLEIQAVKPG